MIINKTEIGVGCEIRGKLNVGSTYGLREYGFFGYGDESDIGGIYQVRSYEGKQQQVKMKYYTPTNPRTEAQQNWRASFATGVSNWQGLSENEKDNWREMAEDRPLTGFNLFLRTYLLTFR